MFTKPVAIIWKQCQLQLSMQYDGLTSKDICGIEYERAYESSAAQ